MFRAVEFYTPTRPGDLLHSGIMSPEELGEYLFRNDHLCLSVLVGDPVPDIIVETLSDEERGITSLDDPPSRIQFYVYSRDSYSDAATAQTSGALYDLASVDSFDEPSNLYVVEDAFSGAKAAENCIGHGSLALAVTTPTHPTAADVRDLAKMFNR